MGRQLRLCGLVRDGDTFQHCIRVVIVPIVAKTAWMKTTHMPLRRGAGRPPWVTLFPFAVICGHEERDIIRMIACLPKLLPRLAWHIASVSTLAE